MVTIERFWTFASDRVEVDLREHKTTGSDKEASVDVGEYENRINGNETTIAEHIEVKASSRLPWHLVSLEDQQHQPRLQIGEQQA